MRLVVRLHLKTFLCFEDEWLSNRLHNEAEFEAGLRRLQEEPGVQRPEAALLSYLWHESDIPAM